MLVNIWIENVAIQLKLKNFPPLTLLRIPHFKATTKDLIYLKGSNGSGKSTFFKFVSGQLDSPNYLFTPIDIKKPIRAVVEFTNKQKETIQTVNLFGQQIKSNVEFTYLNKHHVYFDGDSAGNWFNALFLSKIPSVLTNDILNKSEEVMKFSIINKQLSTSLRLSKDDQALYHLKEHDGSKLYQLIKDLPPLDKISKLIQRKYRSLISPRSLHPFNDLVKHVRRNRFYKLSAGQKQIVMLYRAFHSFVTLQSSLLFLDEPLNYLDTFNKSVIIQEIRDLVYHNVNQDGHAIIFIISHDDAFPFLNPDNKEFNNSQQITSWYIDNDELKELKR
jgi:ABC-type Mn2+/Zn2+ transport system ATPase subunit